MQQSAIHCRHPRHSHGSQICWRRGHDYLGRWQWPQRTLRQPPGSPHFESTRSPWPTRTARAQWGRFKTTSPRDAAGNGRRGLPSISCRYSPSAHPMWAFCRQNFQYNYSLFCNPKLFEIGQNETNQKEQVVLNYESWSKVLIIVYHGVINS
eukprot:970231-Pelagomonas_calceolata.AAC.4